MHKNVQCVFYGHEKISSFGGLLCVSVMQLVVAVFVSGYSFALPTIKMFWIIYGLGWVNVTCRTWNWLKIFAGLGM